MNIVFDTMIPQIWRTIYILNKQAFFKTTKIHFSDKYLFWVIFYFYRIVVTGAFCRIFGGQLFGRKIRPKHMAFANYYWIKYNYLLLTLPLSRTATFQHVSRQLEASGKGNLLFSNSRGCQYTRNNRKSRMSRYISSVHLVELVGRFDWLNRHRATLHA
jgi:hypothetical protein